MVLVPLMVAILLIAHGFFVGIRLEQEVSAVKFFAGGAALTLLVVTSGTGHARLRWIRWTLLAICSFVAAAIIVIAIRHAGLIETPLAISLAASTASFVTEERKATFSWAALSAIAAVPAVFIIAFEWFMAP